MPPRCCWPGPASEERRQPASGGLPGLGVDPRVARKLPNLRGCRAEMKMTRVSRYHPAMPRIAAAYNCPHARRAEVPNVEHAHRTQGKGVSAIGGRTRRARPFADRVA